MASTSSSGVGAHEFKKFSIEDVLKEDESHLNGLSPTMVELYNQALSRVLTGPKSIKLTIDWERAEKGRRVLKCATTYGDGCNYKCYVDDPLRGSSWVMVDFLIQQIKKLVATNVVMRSKLLAYDLAAKSLVLGEEQLVADGFHNRFVEDKDILAYDELMAGYRKSM